MEIDERVERIHFPETDMACVQLSKNKHGVRWMSTRADEPKVLPQAMRAMETDATIKDGLFGAVCGRQLLPMPVHMSPLYLMLSRADKEDAYRSRVVSSISSALWLFQMYFYFTHFFSVNEEDQARINKIDLEHNAHCSVLNAEFYDELGPLYREHPREMEPFVDCMKRFTYDYIHLLEHSILRIVDPSDAIPIEQVLTPAHVSVMGEQASLSDQVVTCNFFRMKGYGLNISLERGGNKNRIREWFPSGQRERFAPGEWMPRALLEDYYVFMDIYDALK